MGIPTKSTGVPDYLGECIKSAGPPDLADSILEEKIQNVSEDSTGILEEQIHVRGLSGNSHKVRSTAGL